MLCLVQRQDQHHACLGHDRFGAEDPTKVILTLFLSKSKNTRRYNTLRCAINKKIEQAQLIERTKCHHELPRASLAIDLQSITDSKKLERSTIVYQCHTNLYSGQPLGHTRVWRLSISIDGPNSAQLDVILRKQTSMKHQDLASCRRGHKTNQQIM